MSLMKNNNNSGSVALKKSLNFTAQVADVIMSINKKGSWKQKTNKLIKTMNNKANSSNLMTQDDIDKLFGRCPQLNKNAGPTKVSTQIADTWGCGNVKNFTKSVKFLRMDDQTDKFLTGLPEANQQYTDQDRINQLFMGSQGEHGEQEDGAGVDLTSVFKKNYLVGKIIGEGAYASVRVAIYKPQDKKIAIKIYEKAKIKDPQRKKSVRRQVKILQLLNHPNIVKILDVVQTNNHLNIVMQYLSGTSLGSYLKSHPTSKLPQKSCKKIFKPLTKALKYMHSLNIAHRDIKLQNIILDEQLNPKLIDFGFSTCIEKDKKIKIFCGTPSYMAPQVVQRKEYRGEGADVWALGVMLFVCVTGVFPFKGATDQELYKKINSSDYPKGQLLFSRSLSDLISKMLKICPQQRITAQQILKHPWLTQNRSDSSKKKTTQISLQNNRKRINTLNSNTSKQNKWAHKTGVVKKVLLETTHTGQQNMKIEIKMALKSPKAQQQQINSYRICDKQNTVKFLKSQKNTHRGKQTSDIKDKGNKTHSKVIDLLRVQMKKRELEKSKSKKRA